MLYPCSLSFFQKLCPAPFSPVSCSSRVPPRPTSLPLQSSGGTAKKSWPLRGKYYIISNPSRCFQAFLFHVSYNCATTASLSGPVRAVDRHTMPARSPSVGIPSGAIGLLKIVFATLGASPAGHLGPNPCHLSPKVTNIPLDQISTPLLWNIWSVASYQVVLKPLTNSYNQDPAPL